ncbi:MAG TPA: hypothetical protein VN636_17395 [Acidimicrobiia bacterium]|nr:hypothetical protein [Acidimicrobiia bacterium]
MVGVASIVVAAIGLFLRSSPTLSGVFLVAGTVMLIVSLLDARDRERHGSRPRPEVDLTSLERSVRTAEAEVARGELSPVDDAHAGTDGTAPMRAFVAKPAAKQLRRTDDGMANALAQELQALPTLEEASRRPPIGGLPAGYRSLALPSGYVVLYRRLTPVELNRATGHYADQDAYLVADLVPVIAATEP